MRVLKWLDRNLWAIPFIAFLLASPSIAIWSAGSRRPVFLAHLPAATRQQLYSSLCGTSSALLGFTVAAVAILTAFGPRTSSPANRNTLERQMTRARGYVSLVLLVTNVFLLMVLITASTALAIDTRAIGNPFVNVLLSSSAVASLVGLLVSGLGLTLVVIERGRA